MTRRLEAERQELEKRLLALEESQSKVELGSQGRASRRLTKKQPVSNSSRSSSTNTERPKSSGGLSSIFRRSRRNSASSDLEFQSAEFNRLQTETNPPSLPLSLPERFGTAITRELQSKHGTALNLSANNKTVRPSTSRLLHSTPKSDDLRENWKTAEAWKAQNGNQRASSVFHNKLQNGQLIIGNAPKSVIPANSASDDLDRELFSAALKHDRKSFPVVSSSLNGVNGNDRATRAISMPISQSMAQAYPPCPAKITIPPEIGSPDPPESAQVSPVARVYHPLQLAQSNSTGNLVRKNRVDPYPRTYKSSPLASNPADTNDSPQEATKAHSLELPDHKQAIQLQSPTPTHHQADDQGERRMSVASWNAPPESGSRFKENLHETPHQATPPEIPAKSEYRSQEKRRSPSDESLRDIPRSPFQASVRSPFHSGNTSHSARSRRTSRDMSDSSHVPQRSPPRGSRGSHDLPRRPGSFIPGHSRTSSHNSDNDGHSTYDTADEEAPESPSFPPEPLTVEPSQPPLILKPTLESENAFQKPSPKPQWPLNQPPQPIPPETRGPMGILKRRSQKAKPRQLTKIFVICCRCKYWHDLPPEVYARLAYPERMEVTKLGPRKKNERKYGSRLSLPLPAAHAVEGIDLRPTPLLPRKVSCCWCAHNMSRACCEGWTALVEMRERHNYMG